MGLVQLMMFGLSLLLTVVVGIVLVLTPREIYEWVYKSQLVLRPESGSFPMWQDLPAPLIASIYIFNVTNADQVIKGAKPELQEVGPYVFTEQHHKTALQWNDNNGTITYKQIRTWNFLPDQTLGTLDDQVTIVNPIAASIAEMIRQNVPKIWHNAINTFLTLIKEQTFVTHRVGDVIFDGFDDPLLIAMKDASFIIKPYVPAGAFMDRFAFFYQRNGSDYVDGVFNMFTGQGNVSDMGHVNSWNYSRQIFFPGSCGEVRGGAGEFYPPGLQKTHIEMFSNDLCRSVKFAYNQTISSFGIETYEYIADKQMFANGTENPDNKCYNPPEQYLPSGVFNTSLCRFGAPVFMSLPHFYEADPYFGDMVNGLSPNRDEHGTYLRIEPLSGVPIEVTARFQLNVLISQVSGIKIFENLPTAYLPVMWFQNSATVPQELVYKMKLFSNLQEIVRGIGWAMIGMSVGLTAILLLQSAFKRQWTSAEDLGPILTESLAEDTDNENVFQE